MRHLTSTNDRGITTLTLNNPENRNALSADLVADLAGALRRASVDQDVRAIVLTHEGPTFSAGADLKSPANPYAFVDLLRALVELPKPVLARVDGSTRAGGLGLLGACDLVLASTASTFAFTEVRIGVAPAIISLTLLPRMDARAASRYYLTGERFDAAEAARIGLITEATDDLEAAVAAACEAFRKAAPQGLAEAKRLVNARVLEAFERDAEDLVQKSASLFASAPAREGMTAFFERRDAAWVL
ncbi:enoyl-CoA hydratase family protein [Streptomyces sp. TRM66268-LWL]|uniref:Enoyl-CoA hydratase family protein n=1 Tax=Streptomyces polyasparticus TaxID=2767826 RepID=A0ABR7SQ24_9ACTN|nr:enoyl-CoA hydratase family protein [Streptomyces polyasparticus]MBC9716438.1 enoyl-CoA hydratase family protein [Streptomyces polyasparticus]